MIKNIILLYLKARYHQKDITNYYIFQEALASQGKSPLLLRANLYKDDKSYHDGIC